jgi:hypothetical protein
MPDSKITYESADLFQIVIRQPQREANYCDGKSGALHPVEEAIIGSHGRPAGLPALNLTLKLLRKKPVEKRGEVSSIFQADRPSNIHLTCLLAIHRAP